MEEIIYIFSNLLRMYAFCILFGIIMGKSRLNHNIEILSFFACGIINSVTFLIFHIPFLNALSTIFPLIAISFQYKKSFVYKLFSAFSGYAIAIAVELLSMSISLPYSNYVVTNTLDAIFMLIVVFVLKFFIRNKNVTLKSNHIWFVVLVSIGSIAVVVLSVDQPDNKTMFIAVIMMLINLLNFYMYDRELGSLQLQHTYKMIESSNKAYQNQLEIMNESQKKIRFLKHDMKNHMFAVKTLISDKKYDKALEYIEEMTESLYNSNEYVSTGNKDIDCLLNFKLSLAKEMGTEFSCDVSLPDSLAVTSFDMTTILGNLLDNSLNALKTADKKYLDIKIKYSKGGLHIDIENTYSPDVKTSRRDNSEHGLGLLSVGQTLEKYHGVINKMQTDETYHVNVFMYNSLE